MIHGARICPRCRTRVDERRAYGLLYCLSCGAPLGTPPPIAPKKPGSAALWIVLGLGLLLVVGAGALGVGLWLASDADVPTPTKKLKIDVPPLETAAPTASIKPKPKH